MNRYFLAAMALTCSSAAAETPEPRLTLGAGAAIVPQFEGSKAYKLAPLANVQYETERFTVSTRGPGVAIDLVPSRKLDAGVIVRAGFGRKGGVDDPLVRLLPRVGTAVELGGFINSGIPLSVLGADDPAILTVGLEAVQDVASGHRGALISGSLGLVRPLGPRTTLIASSALTYASTKYMRAFFDVTAADRARTGLPVYVAGGGIKDVSLTFISSIKLGDPETGRWSITAIASGKRLVGDAARSPIVRLRGTPNQAFGGLALNYQIF